MNDSKTGARDEKRQLRRMIKRLRSDVRDAVIRYINDSGPYPQIDAPSSRSSVTPRQAVCAVEEAIAAKENELAVFARGILALQEPITDWPEVTSNVVSFCDGFVRDAIEDHRQAARQGHVCPGGDV